MVVETVEAVRRRSWIPSRVDGAVALALVLVSTLEAVAFGASAFEVVTGALAPLPLAWRRIHPLLATLLPVPVYWSQVVAGYSSDDVVAPLVVVGFCAYSLAAYAGRWRWLGLVVLSVELATVIAGNPLRLTGEDAAFGAVPVLGGFVAGLVSGSRGRRAVTAEAHALRVEQTAEVDRHAAVAAERLRIARDLHDVLAHSVSVMVVQAGAAQQVLRTDPDRADAAMSTVQETGRRALEETGALVGLLRDGGADVDLTPAPSLTDLEGLVDDVGRAGLTVTVTEQGRAVPLARGTDLSAYRVVQEALTNILRHSSARTARVALRWADHELFITVTDGGPAVPRAAGGGHGLVGMRERVTLVGGALDAGPDGEGFRVHVRLPVSS